MQLELNSKYEYLRDWCSQLPQTFFSQGEVIYDARNQIRVIEGPDGKRYNVKRYCKPFILNRFMYTLLRTPKAKRAYENALVVLERGFDTPLPVAYLLVRKNGLLAESFLITEQSPLTRMCYELLTHPIPEHQTVVRALGIYTARLHEAGILHSDYSPGNILWDINPDGKVNFALVDINRMVFRHVGFREGCREMCRLWGNEALMRTLGHCYAEGRHIDPRRGETLVVRYWRRYWRYRKRP